ncbi:unnamed protein product [Trichogramma brassicae]|uniref:Uncharacterized protein n=1 Tax=Trichogramma brassicae TaxID=86971 RepID=A0A6H5IEJ8_9HYME|nr:unnamed protein product [Trichogramma brassicae]
MWFRVKRHSCGGSGSRHLFFLVSRSRYLHKKYRKIVTRQSKTTEVEKEVIAQCSFDELREKTNVYNMSRLTTFCAIVAALYGLVLLGSIAPASASRALSLQRDIGDKDLLYNGENSVESITTVYYGSCDRLVDIAQLVHRECLVRRVQASFSGGEPKEDECRVSLSSHHGAYISPDRIKVESLGKDRAIVRWIEVLGGRRYYLHFSIVDFSNCRVQETTELPEGEDIDKLVVKYVKGEDDFEVVMLNGTSVSRLSIDAQGVVSKVDKLLTYQSDGHNEPLIFPLKKGEGYLFIEVPPRSSTEKHSITVSHIQPDGN